MAIRLRVVDGVMIALCAAKSVPKEGDVYLDDAMHEALSNKFSRDYNDMFHVGLPGVSDDSALVDREESNNANRDQWDNANGNGAST